MLWGGMAFGMCLGHEDGDLTRGISALFIKESPQTPLTLSATWADDEKRVYEPGRGPLN